MYNILITGERRNNYSIELLTEVKALINCDIGGYWVDITREEANKNIRIFDLTSLCDEDKGNIVFKKDDSTGISKLNIDIFNTKGVEILNKSYLNRDVIIMNEIGFLESKAYSFKKEVKKILDSSKIVIALLKGVSCDYINSIRERDDVYIFEVSESNKENIKGEIIKLLKEWNVKLKSL